VNHMDYLMSHLERFTMPNFVPTNEDILLARQRTTGSHRRLKKISTPGNLLMLVDKYLKERSGKSYYKKN